MVILPFFFSEFLFFCGRSPLHRTLYLYMKFQLEMLKTLEDRGGGRTDGPTDGPTDGWTDGQTDNADHRSHHFV